MRRAKQLSFHDHRLRSGRGGPRPGAGRRPQSANPPVHHVRRPAVPRQFPSHVTLRVRRGLPSLRTRRFLRELRPSLRVACERGDFRVVHYSVQANHLHLLIEAAGKQALGRGMKAVSARVARAVHRAFGLRGRILHGRYHLRVLRTPREVRSALAYVLLNARKHWRERHGAPPPVKLDEASSCRWFDGWGEGAAGMGSRESAGAEIASEPEVARPRTWLLSVGWRRHGRIDPAEVPGRAGVALAGGDRDRPMAPA
jgi:REP element-mobilizing transposase RayT